MALIDLTQKRDGTIEGRTMYNEKPTRDWLSKQNSASQTVSVESIMLAAVIDAHEGRDVMTADVHNAFIQTELPRIDGEERVIMKITGELVDILVNINTDLYSGYILFENGKKVLYVEDSRAIYGMLIVALLFYRKFIDDLEEHGFQFNPYDPCVANKMI